MKGGREGASVFLLPRIGCLSHCSRRAFFMLHCCRILCLSSCFSLTLSPREDAGDLRRPLTVIHITGCPSPEFSYTRFSSSRHSIHIRLGLIQQNSRRFQPLSSFFFSSLCSICARVSELAGKYWTVYVKTIYSSLNLTCLAGKVSAVIRACIVFRVRAAF